MFLIINHILKINEIFIKQFLIHTEHQADAILMVKIERRSVWLTDIAFQFNNFTFKSLIFKTNFNVIYNNTMFKTLFTTFVLFESHFRVAEIFSMDQLIQIVLDE